MPGPARPNPPRLLLSFCLAPALLLLAHAPAFAQEPQQQQAAPAQAQPAQAQTAAARPVVTAEPGEVISLNAADDPPLPEGDAEAGRGLKVYFQRAGESEPREFTGGTILPVRRHLGFALPQELAPGLYTVSYARDGAAERKLFGEVEVRPLPPLTGACVRRDDGGKCEALEVRVPGAAEAEVTLRAAGDAAAGAASLREGQTPQILSESARAVFKIQVRECGRAEFVASAPGYADATLAVECHPKPTTPIPVVFVPGTAGSELDYVKDGQASKYWISRRTFEPERITFGALNEDGTPPHDNIVVRGVLKSANLILDDPIERFLGRVGFKSERVSDPECDPKKGRPDASCRAYVHRVYQEFLERAAGGFPTRASEEASADFQPAPYDWRRGVDPDNARAIDEAVDKALANSGGHDRVILVAHSLGGLVARDYVAGAGRGKVAALVAVGTPWLGAPKTARALLWGYSFDVGVYRTGAGSLTVRDVNIRGELSGKKLEGVPNTLGLSLLNLEEIKRVAVNWPAVFIQLPTPDFMRLYGAASRAAGGEARSVVWDWTPKQTTEFFRGNSEWFGATGNATLYGRVERWRSEHTFRRNDYGVEHLLIGGFADPAYEGDGLSTPTDMQMAKPRDVVEPDRDARRAKKSDSLLRGILGRLLWFVAELRIWHDPYVPVDRGNTWGDATAPLLSASAGALGRGWQGERGPAERDVEAARQFLGGRTRVEVVKLSRGFEHGSMLGDPRVLWEVWKFYRRQNEARGAAFDPRVSTITVEMEHKVRKRPPAWTFELAGHRLELCAERDRHKKAYRCAQSGVKKARKGDPFADPKMVVMHFKAVAPALGPPPKCRVEPSPDKEVRMSQLEQGALRISLRSAQRECKRKRIEGEVEVRRLRLVVNGMEVLSVDEPFTLSAAGMPEWLSSKIAF